MALSSMTGFARVVGQHDAASWVWEVRSVNAKGLDIRLKLPSGAEALDSEARRMLGAVVARGTIHASLELTSRSAATDVRINADLARKLHAQLADVARGLGAQPPGLDAVLLIRGVVEAQEGPEALPEPVAAAALSSLADAIVALIAARREEGEALGVVLQERRAAMAGLVRAADNLPSRSAEAVRERLKRQIEEILGAVGAGLDPQRLHQEAVLLAVKADIREELDRLKAHLAQADDLLSRGGPIGRKLDFLSQELSREINTLCAKSNDVALTAIGLDLKGLVEQFREQVQNVE